MSRLPDLSPEKMTDAQKQAHDEIVSGPHGRIVGPYHVWLQCPELARRARNLSEFIRFKASLPKPLSELGILITGRFWKAEFEFWAHARLAKEAGVDEAIIAAIAAGKRPEFAKEEEEIVYDLCSEMYETRRVSEGTFQRARQALGADAVVELVATIGYYSLVSITLNAFDVPLPEGERSPFTD